ncbi:hypothetical protein E4Z98_07705 [Vagococcus xieshaowenii]|uniref:YdbS-like PH domain-containing protein n=2 Tax=Vagococcus xieshaowenii TaxID=2562451 RepID=A0ABX5TF06_9ENTE|nr:hypothetical protein E4Z98_07705 [Vagococcus xieshaowenii]
MNIWWFTMGFLTKKRRLFPITVFKRLNNASGFFFKPFELIQVSIETAGGDTEKAEANFPVIKEEILHLIEHYRQCDQNSYLNSDVREADQESKQFSSFSKDNSEAYSISNQEIFVFSLTDLGMIPAIFTVFFFLQEYLPKKWFDQLSQRSIELFQAGWLLAIVFILFALVLIGIVSIVRNMTKYYRFSASRTAQTLMIERGLFERKHQTIPLAKIQGIKIKQQLMRKVFGLASVELTLAGGQSSDDTDTDSHTLYLLPIIQERDVFTILNQLLPEWQFEKPMIQFVGRQQMWYFLRWKLLIVLCISAIISYFSLWVGSLVGSFLLLMTLTNASLGAYYQGYALQSSKRLCVQTFRFFTKTQIFIEQDKVQAFSQKTSKWLVKKQIGHVSMWLKSTLINEEIRLKYLNDDDSSRLKLFYREKE